MPAIRSGKVRAALLLGIFLLLLLGNALTPYAVDDWAYMHSFATGERLMHFGEIFPSMAAHAQTMNGRLFSHFWAQLFLLLPKGVFDAVNALVFTALIALLARLVQSEEGPNNLILLMIFFAVWVFVPAFGQVFFWLDGACNYGWGCAAGLAFLAPYIRLFERDAEKKPVFWILWMLAGFYTGAYLENMAVGAIFLSALLLFGRRVLCRKKNGVLPWLPVLSLTNERHVDPDDCIPRVGWGKYQMQNGRLILPICLEVNHKTVDGLHIGRLYEYLQNTIDNL